MLVVSRKKNQTIRFPNLGISVEVLRIAGNAVRIGVAAPCDVRILRGELPDNQEFDDRPDAARNERHALRNRLNSVNLALHLLQKQLEAGRFDDAEETLDKALRTLTDLDRLASKTSGAARESERATGCRALVVEDNANERELLAGYLRLCGYEVDTVEDGLAAMNYLESNDKPDLVLLDMQMPRMDGRKTISAIRRQSAYQGIKLFAVSGADRSSENVTIGRRGVDHWFSKPLRPDVFASQLEEEMSRECAVA